MLSKMATCAAALVAPISSFPRQLAAVYFGNKKPPWTRRTTCSPSAFVGGQQQHHHQKEQWQLMCPIDCVFMQWVMIRVMVVVWPVNVVESKCKQSCALHDGHM